MIGFSDIASFNVAFGTSASPDVGALAVASVLPAPVASFARVGGTLLVGGVIDGFDRSCVYCACAAAAKPTLPASSSAVASGLHANSVAAFMSILLCA